MYILNRSENYINTKAADNPEDNGIPHLNVRMTFDSLKWVGAEAEHDHHPLLIRFREIPQAFPKFKYPERLNVFWKMSEQDHNGLPTEKEFIRLESFEDYLVGAVEHDGHSILVGVLTCNGEKEFVFHTSDVSGFMSRLRKIPQEEERYPITIRRFYDPNWSYFESVIPPTS